MYGNTYNPYSPYGYNNSINSNSMVNQSQQFSQSQYNPQQYNPQQYNQQYMYKSPMVLQGKSVDSIEVVKATDIPLDGSMSYFPLSDGSAIVTKQLQPDGTSKLVVYKPVEDKATQVESNKYITELDLQSYMSDYSVKEIKDVKDEIKSIRRQIEDIIDEIKVKKEI